MLVIFSYTLVSVNYIHLFTMPKIIRRYIIFVTLLAFPFFEAEAQGFSYSTTFELHSPGSVESS